eukprot:6007623-Pyramimonas_sp.AAC.1
MGPEVAARVSKGRRALKPIRVAVAPRLALSLKAKSTLSEALSSSVLFFGGPTWTKLTAAQAQQVHTAHIAVYRTALGLPLTNNPRVQ